MEFANSCGTSLPVEAPTAGGGVVSTEPRTSARSESVSSSMSPIGREGSEETRSRTRTKRSTCASAVAWSKRSAAKTKWPSNPPVTGSELRLSWRSNFAVASTPSTAVIFKSGRLNSAPAIGSTDSATWKSSLADADTTPVTSSNGMSPFANASRSTFRTSETKSPNPAPRSGAVLSASVLTNIPTMSSSCCSPRPATTVPIAKSRLPLNREMRTASAACTTMNNVALCSRAISLSRVAVSALTENSETPAFADICAGR